MLRGTKKFYFSEPTEKTLKTYQSRTTSSQVRKTFLGYLIKDCHCVELKAGNTL